MVGFDVPHVAHDMILRFMGVDFSVINSHVASTGGIPSSVGNDIKPIGGITNPASPGGSNGGPTSGGDVPSKGATPSDDPAMWQGMQVRGHFKHQH